jgi:hypothetical protein
MKIKLISVFLIPCLMLLASCASTKVVEHWSDAKFNARLKNIMVLSLNQSDKSRRLFEDGFLKALSERSIQSSASYDLLPSNENLDREKVKAAIAGSDIDGVLVLRSVKIIKEDSYQRTTSSTSRPNFYAYVGRYGSSSGPVTVEDTLVHLESNLYAVDGAQLIWTVKTESSNPTDLNTMLAEIANKVADAIGRTGFLQ